MWLAQCSFSPLWERMANRVLHRRRQQIQLSTVVHGRVEKKRERKGEHTHIEEKNRNRFFVTEHSVIPICKCKCVEWPRMAPPSGLRAE